MSNGNDAWLAAHARLAAATCGHGQNDARYILNGGLSGDLIAVTHEDGQDVFSVYSTSIEEDQVAELHLSGRDARALSAFFGDFAHRCPDREDGLGVPTAKCSECKP